MCGFYQPPIPPLPQSVDLAGKTVIVTGAGRGIGFETCLQLLCHRVSTLIMAVRKVSDGALAAARLRADVEVQRVNSNVKIEILELDLEKFETVMTFSRRVERVAQSVDLVILNAGINLARWETTEDGHERLIQVNYLSNALLSILLLPVLKESPSPTITIVSSMGQNFTSITKNSIDLQKPIFEHFTDQSKYSRIHRYPDSKLLVAMFVQEFGKRVSTQQISLGKSHLLINCVCPGTVDTTADDNLPFWLRIPMNVNRRLRARTVRDGASALLNAALLHGSGSCGMYISNNQVSSLAPITSTPYGKSLAEKLWNETLEECSKIDVVCKDILKDIIN